MNANNVCVRYYESRGKQMIQNFLHSQDYMNCISEYNIDQNDFYVTQLGDKYIHKQYNYEGQNLEIYFISFENYDKFRETEPDKNGIDTLTKDYNREYGIDITQEYKLLKISQDKNYQQNLTLMGNNIYNNHVEEIIDSYLDSENLSNNRLSNAYKILLRQTLLYVLIEYYVLLDQSIMTPKNKRIIIDENKNSYISLICQSQTHDLYINNGFWNVIIDTSGDNINISFIIDTIYTINDSNMEKFLIEKYQYMNLNYGNKHYLNVLNTNYNNLWNELFHSKINLPDHKFYTNHIILLTLYEIFNVFDFDDYTNHNLNDQDILMLKYDYQSQQYKLYQFKLDNDVLSYSLDKIINLTYKPKYEYINHNSIYTFILLEENIISYPLEHNYILDHIENNLLLLSSDYLISGDTNIFSSFETIFNDQNWEPIDETEFTETVPNTNRTSKTKKIIKKFLKTTGITRGGRKYTLKKIIRRK